MSKGQPSQGYRLTARRRALLAAGYSVEQMLEMTKQPAQIAATLAASLGNHAAPVAAPVMPAAPILAETDEEICARISKSFTVMDKMTGACVDGIVPALTVRGAPGLGKSHNTMKRLKGIKNKSSIINGRVSPVGLFILLYNNRNDGDITVLDDADVFSDEKTLDILLAALDSKKTRTISWFTASEIENEDGVILPKSFEYNGSCIFLTNKDLRGESKSGGKLAPKLSAMLSRSHYIDLPINSVRERLVWIEHIVSTQKMLETFGIREDANKAEILAFVRENAEKFDELSLRMVNKLATLYLFDTEWRDTAAITLMK